VRDKRRRRRRIREGDILANLVSKTVWYVSGWRVYCIEISCWFCVCISIFYQYLHRLLLLCLFFHFFDLFLLKSGRRIFSVMSIFTSKNECSMICKSAIFLSGIILYPGLSASTGTANDPRCVSAPTSLSSVRKTSIRACKIKCECVSVPNRMEAIIRYDTRKLWLVVLFIEIRPLHEQLYIRVNDVESVILKILRTKLLSTDDFDFNNFDDFSH